MLAATVAPASYTDVAAALGEASRGRTPVSFRGGATKASWGRGDRVGGEPPGSLLELGTAGLGRIVEHNVGDLTAVLQAGVRLADAQTRFAAEGQMLALDPPLGEGDAATVGGVFATGDSGPLRHRYGAPRDLALGMTVALADGTVARSGGKVIKNVAGYDLAKLFTGSVGTLGAIVEVVVRLHPRPRATATAVGRSDDPDALARAALALAQAPLELDALDLAWADGEGQVLARAAGAAAATRAAEAAARIALDTHVEEEDEALWTAQRERQRSRDGAVVRISALPTELERALRATADLGGSAAARAGLGLVWARLPADADAVAALRARVAPFPCMLLDAPARVREEVAPPAAPAPALAALERRVRERFDPAGVCNRGIALA